MVFPRVKLPPETTPRVFPVLHSNMSANLERPIVTLILDAISKLKEPELLKVKDEVELALLESRMKAASDADPVPATAPDAADPKSAKFRKPRLGDRMVRIGDWVACPPGKDAPTPSEEDAKVMVRSMTEGNLGYRVEENKKKKGSFVVYKGKTLVAYINPLNDYFIPRVKSPPATASVADPAVPAADPAADPADPATDE